VAGWLVKKEFQCKNKGMRILITGIAGFMGSHLADSMLAEGHEVIGIDNLIGGYKSNVPNNATFINADLRNLNVIAPHFKNIDVVIHSACTAYEGLSVFSPSLVSENTYQITANVLSASVNLKVKKIIYLSSMARYGTQPNLPFTEDMTPKPQDPYGIAKYASELLIENLCDLNGIEYSILVPHNIIGPRQKYDDPFRNVASIMINRMLQNKQPIIYGTGNQKRCFSFMQDVVEPIKTTLERSVANKQVINIGPDNEFISILELANKIADLMSFKLDPIFVPARPQEVEFANCSADKARKILNYNPKVTLEEGLKEMISWIKIKGPKPFEYHLPIEIYNESTPKTWTEKLI
jgi:UDP-glucose 4-epimerase